MTEKEKMLAGKPYNPVDPELAGDRLRAQRLCHALNHLDPADLERKAELLAELFGRPVSGFITPPFHCDYGYNITLGENVYFNVDCVVLDVMTVNIGDNVLIGPGVHIYTATHPLEAEQRRTGLESGKAVTIEDDVWIGGRVVVCPGVRIGAGSVIGTGSVVTRDIPSGVLAAGSPCRVIRRIEARR
jgi:maltose O-acetyltransferase